MESTMTHVLCSHPVDVDHALGDLIRLLATIDSSGELVHEMPFAELAAWFHDRFHLQPGTCSAKALGDAMAFAIRHGLITMGKVSRGKVKVTTYIGVDVSILDAALVRWRGLGTDPTPGVALSPPTEGCYGNTIPKAPWDADLDTPCSPIDYMEAVHEVIYLNILDEFPNAAPEDIWY